MAVKKRYFSLTAKGGNMYLPDGSCSKFTEKIVNIGETADCDIRFENSSTIPEYFASIIRNDDEESWRIVLRSSHTAIHIVGKGDIGYAHQLSDGDIIQIEGQPVALKFQTHYDDKYAETDERRPIWTWLMAIVCGLALAGFTLQMNRSNPICEEDIAPLEESIFLLRVDSVQQKLNGVLVRPTKVLKDDIPTGTAFLTTDSILVTARHCVEYWIGANLDLTTKVARLADDDIIKWAIETETFNQAARSDSTMQLQVFFSVYDFMGEKRFTFSSTDSAVHINRSKDGVFLMADFNKEYYWRSIRQYFTDSQMELGDILWIDNMPEAGKIHLATDKDMGQIKRGSHLMVFGYPITAKSDRQATSAEGINKQELSPDAEPIVFEANINHGFSGGPVFAKTSHGIVAAGVVSRVDSVSSGIFKRAVPITEVKNEK